jgi:hypothetical protein
MLVISSFNLSFSAGGILLISSIVLSIFAAKSEKSAYRVSKSNFSFSSFPTCAIAVVLPSMVE